MRLFNFIVCMVFFAIFETVRVRVFNFEPHMITPINLMTLGFIGAWIVDKRDSK